MDKKALTVVLPIHGYAVPFHINAIKNASKNDEAEHVYLRINFQTPGQLTGKKEDTVGSPIESSYPTKLFFQAIRRPRRDLYPLSHLSIA